MSWIKKNIVWLMFGGVVLLFFLNFSMVFFISDKDIRGTFGDQFGAVNALFSGLAFTGLIYTIILQRRDLELQRHDLKLQRDELALTRKEMEEQTAEFEKQNETLKVQRFENTFFQMLTQFQEIVNNLNFTYLDSERENRLIANGRDCFSIAFEVAPHKSDIPEMKTMNTSNWYIGMRHIIMTFGKEGYMESFSPSYFDHYFRYLYRILKFVKTSPLVKDFDEEYEYTCMLRAMLSRYELVWLYYNGLSEYGEEKLKPLLERYAMLKNLRDELLAPSNEGFGAYKDSAFKKTRPEE
jgi:hypothetical protein